MSICVCLHVFAFVYMHLWGFWSCWKISYYPWKSSDQQWHWYRHCHWQLSLLFWLLFQEVIVQYRFILALKTQHEEKVREIEREWNNDDYLTFLGKWNGEHRLARVSIHDKLVGVLKKEGKPSPFSAGSFIKYLLSIQQHCQHLALSFLF